MIFFCALAKYATLSALLVNLSLAYPVHTSIIDQHSRAILGRDVPGTDRSKSILQNVQAIQNMQKGLSPTGETGAQVAASIGRPPDGDSGVREAAERAQNDELPLSCGQVFNECLARAYDKGSAAPGGEVAVKAGLLAFASAGGPNAKRSTSIYAAVESKKVAKKPKPEASPNSSDKGAVNMEQAATAPRPGAPPGSSGLPEGPEKAAIAPRPGAPPGSSGLPEASAVETEKAATAPRPGAPPGSSGLD